jgi:hypothetical protein
MKQLEMLDILSDVRFMDYVFVLGQDESRLFLQGVFTEPDIVTGKAEQQQTRKWFVSQHMTKSEFVQTVFKMCITSMEHRTREHFRYKGSAVYSPHFDVEALLELCRARRFDYRESI